jgi:hypothetical protein
MAGRDPSESHLVDPLPQPARAVLSLCPSSAHRMSLGQPAARTRHANGSRSALSRLHVTLAGRHRFLGGGDVDEGDRYRRARGRRRDDRALFAGARRLTLGADKDYDAAAFVAPAQGARQGGPAALSARPAKRNARPCGHQKLRSCSMKYGERSCGTETLIGRGPTRGRPKTSRNLTNRWRTW